MRLLAAPVRSRGVHALTTHVSVSRPTIFAKSTVRVRGHLAGVRMGSRAADVGRANAGRSGARVGTRSASAMPMCARAAPPTCWRTSIGPWRKTSSTTRLASGRASSTTSPPRAGGNAMTATSRRVSSPNASRCPRHSCLQQQLHECNTLACT